MVSDHADIFHHMETMSSVSDVLGELLYSVSIRAASTNSNEQKYGLHLFHHITGSACIMYTCYNLFLATWSLKAPATRVPTVCHDTESYSQLFTDDRIQGFDVSVSVSLRPKVGG